MKIKDNMPIIIIVIALLLNIAIGVNRRIGFSALMIRCIVVTIVFGIFGYMLTETIESIIECSRISKHIRDNSETKAELEENLNEDRDKPTLDIKVPPMDIKELMNADNEIDDGFVEVNPVFMGKYNQNEQD